MSNQSVDTRADCPICYEALNSQGRNFIKTECGHDFHANCLMMSVRSSGFNCPYCRTMMVEPAPVTRPAARPAAIRDAWAADIAAVRPLDLERINAIINMEPDPVEHFVRFPAPAPARARDRLPAPDGFVFRGTPYKVRDPSSYKGTPPRCGRCREIGHNSKSCYTINDVTRQQDAAATPSSRFCMRCGGWSHAVTNCVKSSNRTRMYDRQRLRYERQQLNNAAAV